MSFQNNISKEANVIFSIDQVDETYSVINLYNREIINEFDVILNYLMYENYSKNEKDSLYIDSEELRIFERIFKELKKSM